MSRSPKRIKVWPVAIKLPEEVALKVIDHGIKHTIGPKELNNRIMDHGIKVLRENKASHEFVTKCFLKDYENISTRKMRFDMIYHAKLSVFTDLLDGGKGKLNRIATECFVIGAIEMKIIDKISKNKK